MPDWLTGLSRPLRLGLSAAGVVAVGATATVLSRGGEHGAEAVPVVDTSGAPAPGAEDAADDELPGGELEQAPTPIELELEPEIVEWPDEHSVTISGTTAIDAENPKVSLTVTSPSGRRHELEPVPVSSDGSFTATFEPFRAAQGPPPDSIVFGEYEVGARSPGGFGSATGEFKVTRFDEVETWDWKDPADALARRSLELVSNIETCLGVMPPSPAREELKSKVRRLRELVAQGGTPSTPLGSYLGLVMAELKEFPDEVATMEELIEPLEDQLDDWGKEAKKLESEIRHDPGRCLGASTCDIADYVMADLDRLTEATTLLERGPKLIAGYGESGELREALGKAVMVDETFLRGKLALATRGLDGGSPATSGAGSLHAWLGDTRHAIDVARLHAGQELFEPYCERFEGPVVATMEATFTSKQGKKWWQYVMRLEGTLTLRYPETVTGPKMPMTGELTGCATGFKSWDDALRVGWPKLMAGALLYRTAVEPYGGGAICAPFDLPVKAELEDDAVTLTLEPAARKDFGEPSTSVRYVVISPLAGGLPAQTSFTLPYKNAHFIMTRALEGEPLRIPLKKVGKQLVLETKQAAERGGSGAHGAYNLQVKACNPACGR